ncbi:MAG: hypothetical protein ACLFUP_02550 [Desulfobacteraceae bacterium]
MNRIKASPERVMAELAGRGIRVERSHPDFPELLAAVGLEAPGRLPAHFRGDIHAQALTSCLCGRLLSPPVGGLVLDMCAAPGGKTTHMADLMENQGMLVANEPSQPRQSALSGNLSRLGVLNTVITAYQAQQFPMRQRFDHILADVPCSGEGGIRGEGLYREWAEAPPSLLDLQRKILVRGFDLLTPGGVMLYSTCTYAPEENEAALHHLLTTRDRVDVLPLEPGLPYEPGVTSWNGSRYDQRVQKSVRLYPHRVDSVGFFMAFIRRKSG